MKGRMTYQFQNNRNAPAPRRYIGRTDLKENEVLKQQIFGACSLYYVMVGSMYNVLQSAMVDAREVLKQNKKLYRQQIKRDINSAFAAFDKWNAEMKSKLEGANRYQLWLDVPDAVDEKLRPDVHKLFYSIDRWLLKYDIPDHTLKAHLQLVVTLLDMFTATFDKLFDAIQERIKIDIRSLFKGANFRDISFYWKRACKTVLVTKDTQNIDFKDSADCRLAVKIILGKIGSEELYNDASNDALKLNEDCWNDLDESDREILKRGGTLGVESEEDYEEQKEGIKKLKERFAC